MIEILDEIHDALTPRLAQMLAASILENDALWRITRCRVMSYWNCYYRDNLIPARNFSRADYVGFCIVAQLDTAVKNLRQERA